MTIDRLHNSKSILTFYLTFLLAVLNGCATGSDQEAGEEFVEGNVIEEGNQAEPLGEEPVGEDPLAGDPLAGDPLAGDPLAGDPLAGDPLAGDPLAGDPLVGDPLNGDQLLDDNSTTAGTDIITEPDNAAGFGNTNALGSNTENLNSTFAAGENTATPNFDQSSGFTPVQATPINDAGTDSTAPVASAAPSDGSRVYYISSAQVELASGPDSSPNGVILTQGEPVLAKIEGEWANIHSRGWVRIDQLSETPIGRQKLSKVWQ